MDYAFGEQAYETMDELLRPFKIGKTSIRLNVVSVSIMGKAGILVGGKGDIMIPTAHVFEGTADNYPFKNEITAAAFEGDDVNVYTGTMISVLGTSLQNKDVLTFFINLRGMSSDWKWRAHYQKPSSSFKNPSQHQFTRKSALCLLRFRQSVRNRKYACFGRTRNHGC